MAERFGGFWEIGLKSPIVGRVEKPRENGLTMVIDKGLGINSLNDFLELNSQYIDFHKLSFGTSLIYPMEVLKKKISIIKDSGVDVYPGGTLFEIAFIQNKLEKYLFRAKELGFTAIEISDGTISFPSKLRAEAIAMAKSLEFIVLTEVGKKDKNDSLSLDEMLEQINFDLSAGSDFVIIEARESGKDVSIYSEDGSADLESLEKIMLAVGESKEKIIWESPLKKQQVLLIERLGANVNLGNIQVEDVFALESLRRGLRGDTFKATLDKELLKENVVEDTRGVL
ncbi:phosphosulfolactate synthase [Natronospora cellulosivora (SeqCode)]